MADGAFDYPVPTAATMLTDAIGSEVSVFEKLALTLSRLDAEAAKVDPSPTEAQKESGNYRKGHVSWKGLDITIETAAGQTRSGTDKSGKAWSITMKDSYGYFKRTESDADGDHVDVFLCTDNLDSELVFVVNQDVDGKFDEHKVVVGVVSEEQARKAYLRNYAPGWKGLGSIAAMTLAQFKSWLTDGDTGKPVKTAADLKSGYEPGLVLIKRAADDDSPFTIAVDLDGTLAEKEEPFDPTSIGPPRNAAVTWVRKFKDAGARIIIFTVRGDADMVAGWLDENDVPYDYINENPDQPEDSSGKVIADVYWDDRAYNAVDPDEHGPDILAMIDNSDPTDGNEQVVIIERTRVTIVPGDLLAVLQEA